MATTKAAPGKKGLINFDFLQKLGKVLMTVIAVFENLIAYPMDAKLMNRPASSVFITLLVIVLSLPCVLGFNLWSGFTPFGPGSNVLSLEDFIVSNNLLPLGSLVYLAFCTSRYGWGWNNFIKEADTGKGMVFPKWIRFYATWILPLIVLYIFAAGYYAMFFK